MHALDVVFADHPHLSSLVLLLLSDLCARRLVRHARNSSHTRWCVVHAAVNVALSALAWPSLLRTLAGQATLFSTPHARAPVALALWLHAYHAACYELSADDRVHHLVYALVLGLPSYHHAHDVTAAMLVFLSGIPGALLYTLVALRRCGRCTHVHEPLVSAVVNLGLRFPGVWACTARFLSLLLLHSRTHTPTLFLPRPVALLQLVLPVVNVVYYALQSLSRVRRRRRKA